MYQQNASQVLHFTMVTTAGAADSTVTSGLGMNRILGNGALSSVGGNVVNKGAGAFALVMSSGDTNAGQVGIFITAPGDVPLMFTFMTTPANPYDSVRFGLTGLANAVPGAAGGLQIAGSNAPTVFQSMSITGISAMGSMLIGGSPNSAQSGDAFGRLGVAGVGLTNLGDTRLNNLDSAVSTRLAGNAQAVLNIDTAVSTRMATYAQPAGFLAATFPAVVGDATAASQAAIYNNVTSITTLIGPAGAALTSISLNSIERNGMADALLNRDFTLGSDTNTHSLRNAARFLRNSWSIAGGVLTVTKEDQVTTAWTGTVATTPGANPVTGNTTT